MHEQRTERKFRPRVVVHKDERKIAARFYHAGRFGERSGGPLLAEMIDRIRADDGIEGKFARAKILIDRVAE